MNQLLAMRAFIRVAEARSFSRAAEQLSLPRSTVSKLIVDLERHLNTKLVQRTTRAVTLTTEGLQYLDMISGLIIGLEEAESRIRGERQVPHGRLRVDVTSSFANAFLIPRLHEFRAAYPQLTLELGISDRTVDVVREGADCVIRAGELADTSLITKRLFEAQTAICASPEYLARHGTPRAAKDLHMHVLVGYFVARTSRPMPITLTKGELREEIRDFSVMTNESTGHIQMLCAGLGIGQEIKAMMQERIDAGDLVPLLEDWQQPVVTYNILYPPNRHQSMRLRVFIDWIVEQVARAGL